MGIKLKRSAVASKAPAVADLELGELAVNTFDGNLYLKKNDGSDAIVEVGPVRSVAGRTGAVGGSPAENDMVIFEFYRAPANAADTMAGDAQLIEVTMTYTVNAAKDD